MSAQAPNYQLSDFDFDLPEALIAQHPAAQRSASRLLHVHGGRCDDRYFKDLPELLMPGDLLVMNDTRVIAARLLGHKASGGQVEVLVERLTDEFEALVQLRASKVSRAGTVLDFDAAPADSAPATGAAHAATATVVERAGEFYRLRFDAPVLAVLERCGRVPLPPYITHAPEPEDRQRYQTVYARDPGSVAAPTAGLHFDEELLARLAERGIGQAFVTLHVGAGTFQPVRSEDLSAHRMHAERFTVPPATAAAIARTRAAGGRVVAVGTTSLRTLESVANDDGSVRAGSGETALFVTPGYRFRVVDALITNFHLPRSTLLMLVSAFAGFDQIRTSYRHALAQGYRFFSYGDAMLLERAEPDRAGAVGTKGA